MAVAAVGVLASIHAAEVFGVDYLVLDVLPLDDVSIFKQAIMKFWGRNYGGYPYVTPYLLKSSRIFVRRMRLFMK